jgi:hypothetical protein
MKPRRRQTAPAFCSICRQRIRHFDLVTRIPGRGWAHHTCTIQANQANQAKEGTTP